MSFHFSLPICRLLLVMNTSRKISFNKIRSRHVFASGRRLYYKPSIDYIKPKTKLRIWLCHVMTQEPRQHRKKLSRKWSEVRASILSKPSQRIIPTFSFVSLHISAKTYSNILFRIESHFSKAYGLNVFLNFI